MANLYDAAGVRGSIFGTDILVVVLFGIGIHAVTDSVIVMWQLVRGADCVAIQKKDNKERSQMCLQVASEVGECLLPFSLFHMHITQWTQNEANI